MVIFHSYVSLPEGNSKKNRRSVKVAFNHLQPTDFWSSQFYPVIALPSVTHIPMHLGYNSCGRPDKKPYPIWVCCWVYPWDYLSTPKCLVVGLMLGLTTSPEPVWSVWSIMHHLSKLDPTMFIDKVYCRTHQWQCTRYHGACHKVHAKAKAITTATVKTLKSLVSLGAQVIQRGKIPQLTKRSIPLTGNRGNLEFWSCKISQWKGLYG
jgi:hypothetical protein